MADSRGGKNTQTKAILDKLKSQDVVPDDLLPEESEVKKKKKAKQFFEEVAYLVFMESIHIYENNLIHMRKLEDSIQLAYEQSLKNSRNKELELVLLMETKRQLAEEAMTREQYAKLNAVIAKLESGISALDEQIKHLITQITEQTQKVEAAFADVVSARRELADSWTQHFERQSADPDFQPMRVNIDISNEWMQIPEVKKFAKTFKGHIEIDKTAHRQLGIDIANDLKNGESSAAEVKNVVEKKVHAMIEKILQSDLSFLPQAHRDKFIADNVRDKKAYHPVIDSIWKNVLDDKDLLNHHKKAFEAEKIYTKAALKLEILKEAKKEAELIREELEKEKTALVAIALGQKEGKIADKSAALSDTNLQSLTESVENKVKQIETNKESVNAMQEKIDSDSEDYDACLEAVLGIKLKEDMSPVEHDKAIHTVEEIHHQVEIKTDVSSQQSKEEMEQAKEKVPTEQAEENVTTSLKT